MWNFFCGTQRDKVHVLHLFEIIGDHTETLTAAEVGIQESVGNLVFISLG